MNATDRSALRAATERMIDTYRAGDRRGYWTDFLATADIELPPEVFEMMFGAEPDGRDAEDERFGVEQMHLSTTFWQPPINALRDGGVPVMVGIGAESAGELCDRSSRALAATLDLEPTMFPGDHIGFADQPDAFAVALRDTLGTLRR